MEHFIPAGPTLEYTSPAWVADLVLSQGCVLVKWRGVQTVAAEPGKAMGY